MDTIRQRNSRGCRTLFLSAMLFATGLRLIAQSTGTISGNVVDQSGGLVPGATVTATLVEQQLRRSVTTGSDGFYSFAALQPGSYSITVEKPGFQRSEQQGITLTLNQNLRLDV